MANSRIEVLIGAGLVVFGSALPVLRVPVYGSITLLETNVGGVTVIAAVAGAVLGALGLWIPLRIAAGVSACTYVFFLSNVFVRLSGNRAQISALTDKLGGSFSLEYGIMFVIAVGVILMLNNSKIAPLIAPKKSK